MALAPRYRNFSPFVRLVDRDDDRYGGVQFGFVTYHTESDTDSAETYKVSLAEFGGRSDHLAEPLLAACGAPIESLSVDQPLDSDAELLRSRPEPEVVKKPDLKVAS